MTPKLPDAFLRLPLAHRALHDFTAGRPENSRAAVKAAIAAGYGIEIDVQRSADNAAMVFHDYDLPRLAHGKGAVQDHSAQDLGRTTLRGADEGIPTLQEVLDLVAGAVPLLIEIKDQDGEMGPNVSHLEEAVATALSEYKGPVAVMSFNPHSVIRLAQLVPEIPRGLVTSSYSADDWDLPEDIRLRLRDIPDYDAARCAFISHDRRDLDRPRVAELKGLGAHILCWTVRSPQQEAQARKIAHNITFEQYLASIEA